MFLSIMLCPLIISGLMRAQCAQTMLVVHKMNCVRKRINGVSNDSELVLGGYAAGFLGICAFSHIK